MNPLAHRFTLALLMLASPVALADSWAPPTTKITESANGQFRVTVVPRPLAGALAYFQDKVDGVGAAGQRKGEAQVSPVAMVEKRDGANGWRAVWQMPLVNDVAPTSVRLSNDGSRLVTFDNWHSVGLGDDVVVIYDEQGDLVRKLSLDQIVPAAYVAHLPRTVSSLWWGGEHALVADDRFVELQVVLPGADMDDEAPLVPVRVRLADGEVVPPSGKAWDEAIATLRTLEEKRLAAWSALRLRRASPLPAPTTSATQAWRDYVFELRDRIAGAEEGMGGMVLAAPGHEPHFFGAGVSGWVTRFDVADKYAMPSVVMASPTSQALATLLVNAFRERAPDSMQQAHVVFVGTRVEAEQVAKAARHTGAKITWVDVVQPYPAGKPLPQTPPLRWSE